MKKQLDIKKVVANTGQIPGVKKNPRVIKDAKYYKLVQSITESPEFMEHRGILVFPHNKKYVAIGGNQRLKAATECGLEKLWCEVLPEDTTPEKLNEYIIKDNASFGEWDIDALADEWSGKDLNDWGVDMWNDEVAAPKESKANGSLQDKFIVPPFSILDTRRGYWMNRKKLWRGIIGDQGESREGTLSESELMGGINSGVSLLDPVLAEIVCKWFGVEGGNAFDCFAGDTVFGYVAAHQGMNFTGVELRQEQADLNNKRVAGMPAQYICDDGQNVEKHIEAESQDLLFSCPPYFDLEVYSDLENDASNQGTYEDFIKILRKAFTGAIKCIKQNRFAVITVGDIRGKDGFYYDFCGDIKRIFAAGGMRLYNEMILVEPIGTLPQRVGRYMNNRKIGKCHQNVLVFYKGNPAEISNEYPKIEFNPEDIGGEVINE